MHCCKAMGEPQWHKKQEELHLKSSVATKPVICGFLKWQDRNKDITERWNQCAEYVRKGAAQQSS